MTLQTTRLREFHRIVAGRVVTTQLTCLRVRRTRESVHGEFASRGHLSLDVKAPRLSRPYCLTSLHGGRAVVRHAMLFPC